MNIKFLLIIPMLAGLTTILWASPPIPLKYKSLFSQGEDYEQWYQAGKMSFAEIYRDGLRIDENDFCGFIDEKIRGLVPDLVPVGIKEKKAASEENERLHYLEDWTDFSQMHCSSLWFQFRRDRCQNHTLKIAQRIEQKCLSGIKAASEISEGESQIKKPQMFDPKKVSDEDLKERSVIKIRNFEELEKLLDGFVKLRGNIAMERIKTVALTCDDDENERNYVAATFGKKKFTCWELIWYAYSQDIKNIDLAERYNKIPEDWHKERAPKL